MNINYKTLDLLPGKYHLCDMRTRSFHNLRSSSTLNGLVSLRTEGGAVTAIRNSPNSKAGSQTHNPHRNMVALG